MLIDNARAMLRGKVLSMQSDMVLSTLSGSAGHF